MNGGILLCLQRNFMLGKKKGGDSWSEAVKLVGD